MDFPERIYTLDELKKAREAIAYGHRHKMLITGDPSFQELISVVLSLIELAGYEDLLAIYIREIRQMDGISQLRETEATIWINKLTAKEPIEGARFVVQKMFQMKSYVEGRVWYILGEAFAVRDSVEFLRKLRERSKETELKKRCDLVIDEWTVDKVL